MLKLLQFSRLRLFINSIILQSLAQMLAEVQSLWVKKLLSILFNTSLLVGWGNEHDAHA